MLAPEALLDAAIRVVSRDGLGALTLDAVAKEAGVSKGGLTHHYATKDALVTAMLEHFAQRLLRELDRFAADDPELKGRRIRAMMKVGFPELRDDAQTNGRAGRTKGTATKRVGTGASSEVQQFFLAAITASVVNPDLLKPLRHHAGEMRERMMGQSPDGLWQVVTWLALDGLMLWQMLGLLPKNDPLQSRMLRLLYTLSSEPPAAVLEQEAQDAAS